MLQDYMTVYEIVDKMYWEETSVDKMYEDNTYVDKMTLDEIFLRWNDYW